MAFLGHSCAATEGGTSHDAVGLNKRDDATAHAPLVLSNAANGSESETEHSRESPTARIAVNTEMPSSVHNHRSFIAFLIARHDSGFQAAHMMTQGTEGRHEDMKYVLTMVGRSFL